MCPNNCPLVNRISVHFSVPGSVAKNFPMVIADILQMCYIDTILKNTVVFLYAHFSKSLKMFN